MATGRTTISTGFNVVVNELGEPIALAALVLAMPERTSVSSRFSLVVSC